MQKIFLTADQLLRDSIELGIKVVDSGFRPDLVVGVWRGGTPVAIAVHEVLQFVGLRCDHIAVRTTSYTGIATRTTVEVHGLDYLRAQALEATSLLIVDDVFDTGLSVAQLLAELRGIYAAAAPDIRVAVPYYKPLNNQTRTTPDYYLHEASAWLVFPHELQGLEAAELRSKPGLLQHHTTRLCQLRDVHRSKDNPTAR